MSRFFAVILLMFAYVMTAAAADLPFLQVDAGSCVVMADEGKDGKKDGQKEGEEEEEPDCD